MAERELGALLIWYGILLVAILFAAPTLWHDWQEERRAKRRGLNGDAKMRQVAARALGELGEPRAVEPLIVTLRDESPLVRQAAAESLGQLKDRRAVEPLRATLTHDPNSTVRLAAAEALGRLRDSSAAETLITILTPETPKASV